MAVVEGLGKFVLYIKNVEKTQCQTLNGRLR